MFSLLGVLFLRVYNPFLRVLCVMSHKVPCDAWLWSRILQSCVSGQGDHFDAFKFELLGFWVARDIVQYQKNFKRHFLTGKVLPDIRDKAMMGLMFSLFRHWQPTPVFLPGGSHRQRSLAGYTVHGVAKSQTQLKQFSTHVAQLKLGFIILNLTFLYSDCIYFSLACEPFCKLTANCFRVR